MKFYQSFTSLSTLAAQLVSIAAAAPLDLEKRDVYTPPVLYPHSGTVWKVGARHNVTWDISDPPVNITNKVGQIWLRKGEIEWIQNGTLASNFSILAGRVEVTVPDTEPANDYSVVLYGDSTNWSQMFTIID
ncbi:hypothetical protein BV25DRAFT_1724835 [Artomyces pyxidatus]|uniref:Uncharacterized protein n=1 Tax=Artomyces pyxidatus TaxID=48021 RepID=A0ACB8SJ56_9AGAM|nr:hypothetical protein BV25DRAFT_1724835 [Artomyces pyxidatus]